MIRMAPLPGPAAHAGAPPTSPSPWWRALVAACAVIGCGESTAAPDDNAGLPAKSTLTVGSSFQLTPRLGTDGPFTWTVSDPAVAALITSPGDCGPIGGCRVYPGLSATLHALTPGTANVRVTAGGRSATLVLTVSGAAIATVRAVPDALTLSVGGTAVLQATPLDSAGQPAPRQVRWSVSDPGVLALLPGGAPLFNERAQIWAGRAGTAVVTATSEGRRAEIVVQVVDLVGNVEIVAVSAGAEYTCGLPPASVGGGVHCWRSLSAAGTGIVGVGRSIAFVSAGDRHACAVGANGLAYCWGDNFLGQRGNGLIEVGAGRNSADVVRTDSALVALSAGSSHTCALTAGGTPLCWGYGTHGERGDGDTTQSRPLPTRVAGGHRFADIDAGDSHTCAVTADGATYCWGLGTSGQLGGAAGSLAPTVVPGAPPMRRVSAGGRHTCGLAANGSAYCWGANDRGQLGAGPPGGGPTPQRVPGEHALQAVSAGREHTCALASDGVAYCWGWSRYAAPTPVSGGLTFRSIDGSGDHTCAMTVGGAAYCWRDDLVPTRLPGQRPNPAAIDAVPSTDPR